MTVTLKREIYEENFCREFTDIFRVRAVHLLFVILAAPRLCIMLWFCNAMVVTFTFTLLSTTRKTNT
jgi:hypothetical protein